MMLQYDAHRRFIRQARFNATLYRLWAAQVPYGRIIIR